MKKFIAPFVAAAAILSLTLPAADAAVKAPVSHRAAAGRKEAKKAAKKTSPKRAKIKKGGKKAKKAPVKRTAKAGKHTSKAAASARLGKGIKRG